MNLNMALGVACLLCQPCQRIGSQGFETQSDIAAAALVDFRAERHVLFGGTGVIRLQHLPRLAGDQPLKPPAADCAENVCGRYDHPGAGITRR